MGRTEDWLAGVFAARGDSEPPLEPAIPATYLEPPRRQPKRKQRDAAWASRSEPSEPALDKRARYHDTMPDTPPPSRPRSPLKRTRDEAHLDATSRQPQLTGIARLAIQAEEHDDKAGSIAESEGSRTSKRSLSPTKRIADLWVADKKINVKSVCAAADVPYDVRELYNAIRQCDTYGLGIVPKAVQTEVEAACCGSEPFVAQIVVAHNDSQVMNLVDFRRDHARRTVEDDAARKERLVGELHAIKDIRDGTVHCRDRNVHEVGWNERVHSKLLHQAVRPLPGLAYENITTARVIKELVPQNHYGEEFKKKMVDYAITLEAPLIGQDAVTRRLAATAAPSAKICRSINPTDYSPVRHFPMAVSIETKSASGDQEKAMVQLSIWVAAHFARLRRLSVDPIPITLPLVLVQASQWNLLFARDLEDSMEIITAGAIGNSESILGCYKILAGLRHLCHWATVSFQPWFVENVLSPE